MNIDKDTTIEDIIVMLPESVSYFMKKGIKCISCGDIIWGTIYEVCIDKGYKTEEINDIINDLNKILKRRGNT